MNRRILGVVVITGALGAGMVAGFFLGVPGLSGAQVARPTPSSSAAPGPRLVVPGTGWFGGMSLGAAAKALGMSTTDLRTALGSGQSLAAIATSKNVSVQKVIAALSADATSRIDAAVKAGKLTTAQADTLKQNLAARINALVNRTFPAGGRGFRRGPNGGPSTGPTTGPSTEPGPSGAASA